MKKKKICMNQLRLDGIGFKGGIRRIKNDFDIYTKYIEATSNTTDRNANIVSRHNALEESYKVF